MRILPSVLCSCLFVLTGCSAMNVSPSSPVSVEAGALHGAVHGGVQPVTGAKVYLLEGTVTGYGAASKSLLTSATGSTADSIGYSVTTDLKGGFTITGDYTCDSGKPVYLLVLGGNSGSGVNANTGLMTTLGNCPTAAPFTFAASTPTLWVNEVTTAATAFALSAYMTDPTHFSGSANPQALLGMQHAALNFTNLVDVATGVARTTAASDTNSIGPTSLLDTIANILASCVNSTDAQFGNCTTLFGLTLSAGAAGTTPTNTAAAAINLAHYPAASASVVSSLFGLQPGTGAPYQPSLSSAPSDYVLGMVYTGYTRVFGTARLAADSTGRIWLSNQAASGTGGQVVSVESNGKPGSVSFTIVGNPQALVIDAQDNVWTTYTNSLEKHSSTGVAATGSPFSSGGLYPNTMTVDAQGSVWMAYGAVLTKHNSDGSDATGSPFALPNVAFDQMAAAVNGTIYIPAGSSGQVFSVLNNGTESTSFTDTCANNQSPKEVALDSAGNFFLPTNSGVCVRSAGGAEPTSAPITNGQTLNPMGGAVDGANRFFHASGGFGSGPLAISNTGVLLSPGNGFGGIYTQGTGQVKGLAVDSAGSVWTYDTSHNRLIQLIGLGAPTVTPLAANLVSPYGTAAVNKP